MEQKSSAALVVLKQIVNRTIEQISHLDKFALRDVSVGHPVVNRLSGYSQLLRKGFHGKPKATPFGTLVMEEMQKIVRHQSMYKRADFQRGLVRLTPMGKTFVRVCFTS